MAMGKDWNKEKVIELLEPFLKLGYSVNKACENAGIPQSTVATWISDDEELRLKIHAWQNEINAQARKVIDKAIRDGDKDMAKWWAERREKDSFSTRSENINTNVGIDEIMKSFADPDGKIEDPNDTTETPE